MQPRHSLYIYKDLSLDHNLNQVSVVCILIPCVTEMLIQVVSLLACSSHFPMHIQYVTILIHLDFINFIIYDREHKFWRFSLSSSHFLTLSIYSPLSLLSNTVHLHSSLRVENNFLYLCKIGKIIVKFDDLYTEDERKQIPLNCSVYVHQTTCI